MPVKIFFPRVPDNEEEFLKLLGQVCPSIVSSVKFIKNPDGRPFCIIPVNYSDTNGKCANDIIEAMNGKAVGEVILKPRMYLDSALVKQLDLRLMQKEMEDDLVNVTHYYNDYYYIQLKSEKERNKVLREKLRTLYGEYRSNMLTTLEFEELSEGQLYATVFMNDESLYRVKVVENCSVDKIKVLFIDYGNIETIDSQPILDINEDLAVIPPLAHKCCIDNIRIIDEKKHDLYSREVLNRNFKAKIIKTINEDGLERVTSVDFLNFCMVSYRIFLILESVAVEDVTEDKKNVDYKEVKSFENGVEDKIQLAVMTHMYSLDEFYVQRASKDVDSNLSLIVQLTDYLTSRLRDNLQYIDDTIIYLTKFTDDGNWYRSKVVKSIWDDPEESHCVVKFIDFGNSEKKYSVKDLKPLTKEWCEQASELSAIPPCAHQCEFNKTLIKGLMEAKVDVGYFIERMILVEKIMKLCYYDNGEVWTVSNVIKDGEDDFITRYNSSHRKVSSSSASSDLYCLSNMESIHKIWFQLVYSADPERNMQVKTIKKWNLCSIPTGTRPLTSVSVDKLYCAANRHGHLYRCRVTGRNIDRAIVQFIDSGLHEVIKLSSLFALPTAVANISPLSKHYQLCLKVRNGQEEEVEKTIVKFLQHSEVELNLESDNVIKDVIVKERSLVERLAEYQCEDKEDKYKDLPECLLPPVTEEGDVDFSLPSVDKMNEVPLDIAVENGRVRMLRKLFHMKEDDKCIFDEIWAMSTQCEQLDQLVECCVKVESVCSEMQSVKSDICEVVMNRASKYRDLQPLLDRRMSLCSYICHLNDTLQTLLSKTAKEDLELLMEKVQTLLSGITNILDILHLTVSTNTADINDISVLQEQVALFYQSALYRETLLPQIQQRTHVTDVATDKFRGLVEVMLRHYQLADNLPNVSDITVPLVDVTYEVHSAMQSESSFITEHILSHPDVNITSVLSNCHQFLHSNKTALQLVLSKTLKLRCLHEIVLSIIAEDTKVVQMIENTHKKVLTNRSALRHAVPDLEDAEELDLKERQQELTVKVRDIRRSLHVDLEASKHITEDHDICQLMLIKPELQLKNQSIFFHDKGMPIFLWDSIYFDMSHESSSVDSYVDSLFCEDKIKIRKISLLKEHYKTTLSNISVFSSTLSSIKQDIDIVPILFAFMSKSGHIAIYVVVPDITIVTELPSQITESISTIITFISHVLSQIVQLWHLGYIYTEDDLRHGLFYLCNNGSEINRVNLALPLSSIISRDEVSESKGRCEESPINVSTKKVGLWLKETLERCHDNKLQIKEQEALGELVNMVDGCGEIEDVESVIEHLEEFVSKLGSIKEETEDCENGAMDREENLGCSSSLSGHGSSIEQVKDDIEEMNKIVDVEEDEHTEDEHAEDVENTVVSEVKENFSEFE